MFKEVDRPSLFDGFIETAKCYQYGDSPVFFLMTRMGNAMELHVGAVGREGKQQLRAACRDVMRWVFRHYGWCEMILAPVKRRSVYNLCRKLGFMDGGFCDYYGGQARLMIWAA